jgi:hypothetical protein
MVEFGKLLGQAGGKQMYSQSVCRCAVASNRQRLKSDGETTLIEDCVYVGAKQQGVARDVDGLDLGTGRYTVAKHCISPKPVDFGTRDEVGVLGAFDGSSQATGDVAREEGVRETALTRQRPAGRHVGHSELRPARR